jgi:DNA helicase-2/ATP-dependent DNA helicase PcrA
LYPRLIIRALCRFISNTSIPSSWPQSHLPEQHALILAGAGSGKTRVLTTRIAWLVRAGHVSPAACSRDLHQQGGARDADAPRGHAAGPSARDVDRHVPRPCQSHAALHYRDAGLPQTFQILDSQDQLAAVKRMLKGLNADEDRFPSREVQSFINSQKEEGLRAGDVPLTEERTRRFVDSSRPTTSSASAKARSTSPSCCCAPTSCSKRNEVLRAHYASASATS